MVDQSYFPEVFYIVLEVEKIVEFLNKNADSCRRNINPVI